MKKTSLNIIIFIIFISIGILLISFLRSNNVEQAPDDSIQNVEIKNGIQYVTINAKAGYSPKVSTAKAGIPTKLIVKTNNTYDCSAALVIRELNFQQILPQTGNTEIDLGVPKANIPLQGLCSMGMYNFLINFI